MSINPALWSPYTPYFDMFHTEPQIMMYKTTARYTHGHVIDLGAGCAKLAPFLPFGTTQYTGVDYNETMVERGKALLDKLGRQDFSIECREIEEVTGVYDCAVSLQSHYSWAKPVDILKHIHTLVRPGGTLILASASASLDIDALLIEAGKPWVGVDGWDCYKEQNQALATDPNASFLTLDAFIKQVQSAGFEIKKAHDHLFDDGLNFVVASKD